MKKKVLCHFLWAVSRAWQEELRSLPVFFTQLPPGRFNFSFLVLHIVHQPKMEENLLV